ncbi:hypothetical protein PanWU01x14_050660, partial [Parasponia andersonii]
PLDYLGPSSWYHKRVFSIHESSLWTNHNILFIHDHEGKAISYLSKEYEQNEFELHDYYLDPYIDPYMDSDLQSLYSRFYQICIDALPHFLPGISKNIEALINKSLWSKRTLLLLPTRWIQVQTIIKNDHVVKIFWVIYWLRRKLTGINDLVFLG